MRAPALVFVLFCVSGCVKSQTGAARTILPLKTLRLYETGVGYFARSGELDANSSMSLPVPASHLDDALKTLVVLGGDKQSQIQGMEFASSVSRGMARAMAGLPQDSSTAIDWRDLLTSLTGSAVEVRSAEGVARGRIVDVADGISPMKSDEKSGERTDDKSEDKKGSKRSGDDKQAFTLLLLTEQGELRRFASNEMTAVRPLDGAFAPRLGSALDALSTRAAQTEHAVRLLAHASGPVTLGYIAEVPLYRTTWRLVLDEKEKATTLVGWALLHNDTDEDWSAVKIELVNGQPDSFLFPLAAPRYARRELLHPDAELSTVPQLLDKTPDSIWGDHVDATEGVIVGEGYGMGSIGTMGHGSGGGGSGSGFGRMSGRTSSSDELSVGNLAGVANAEGTESGALFTYSLAEPLDLHSHGSALVPFLKQSVDAQPITWLESESDKARTAVRFLNSTRQTLPAGPIAFFEKGGFSGESTLDRLKPGERRFLQYGNDLDVELTVKEQSSSDSVKRVRFLHDRLEEHYLRTRDATYEFENRSGAPKHVFVVMTLNNNATIKGADRLDYDTTKSQPLAVFDLAEHNKGERKITTIEGLSSVTAIDGLAAIHLDALAQNGELPAATRTHLAEAAKIKRDLDTAQIADAKLDKEMEQLNGDLDRLRKDLEALGEKGGSATGQNPFVQRILLGEDRLAALRHKVEAGAAEKKRMQEELKSALKSI